MLINCLLNRSKISNENIVTLQYVIWFTVHSQGSGSSECSPR